MKTEADSPSEPLVRPQSSRPSWKSSLRYWLPVVLWMTLIFGFSTEAGASRRTSRLIGPFLRWLNPEISDEAIRSVQLVIRKSAHLAEYAILALLVWRARRQSVRGERQPWRRADAYFAFAVAALFAVTDEWHQSFVPSREGKFVDVLIDSTGAALGLLACWSFGRWRKFW